MPSRPTAGLLTLLLVSACAGDTPAPCGFTHFAGATMLLEQFRVPQQTLSTAPEALPERLVARAAAGPAYPAFVGRVDSMLAIGVEGALPDGVELGYGVLVLGTGDVAQGVVLYQGDVIPGAPILGTVTMGSAVEPLIGVAAPAAAYEDAACPLFPDSILR